MSTLHVIFLPSQNIINTHSTRPTITIIIIHRQANHYMPSRTRIPCIYTSYNNSHPCPFFSLVPISFFLTWYFSSKHKENKRYTEQVVAWREIATYTVLALSGMRLLFSYYLSSTFSNGLRTIESSVTPGNMFVYLDEKKAYGGSSFQRGT